MNNLFIFPALACILQVRHIIGCNFIERYESQKKYSLAGRKRERGKNLFVLYFASCFLLISCSNNNDLKTINSDSVNNNLQKYDYMEGNTQGSTFHIKYKINGDSIKISDIYSIFSEIDNSLSIYIDSSIISRINNNDTSVTTDKYFEDVFAMSDSVYKLSNGLFDITVGQLVKAWGFTPGGHKKLDTKQISKLKAHVGFNKIKLINHKLLKSDSRILLDPNAIAQGYTCEVVADYFISKEISDYMIEIGGEVKTKGLNDKGKLWKIGIDKPIDENRERELQTILLVTNTSVCTSGSYRKFVEENGIKYSHTINPKTGYPTHQNLLSVTVVTQNCTYADAVATALMVMGLDDAKKFVENHKEIEAYFIFVNKKGEYETWNSERLNSMIKPLEYKDFQK